MDIKSTSELPAIKPPAAAEGDLLARLIAAGTIDAEVIGQSREGLLLRSLLGDLLTDNSLEFKPGDRLRIRLDNSGARPVLKVSREDPGPLLLAEKTVPQLAALLPRDRAAIALVTRLLPRGIEIRLASETLILATKIATSEGQLLSLRRQPANAIIEIRPLQSKSLYKAVLQQMIPRQDPARGSELVRLLNLLESALSTSASRSPQGQTKLQSPSRIASLQPDSTPPPRAAQETAATRIHQPGSVTAAPSTLLRTIAKNPNPAPVISPQTAPPERQISTRPQAGPPAPLPSSPPAQPAPAIRSVPGIGAAIPQPVSASPHSVPVSPHPLSVSPQRQINSAATEAKRPDTEPQRPVANSFARYRVTTAESALNATAKTDFTQPMPTRPAYGAAVPSALPLRADDGRVKTAAARSVEPMPGKYFRLAIPPQDRVIRPLTPTPVKNVIKEAVVTSSDKPAATVIQPPTQPPSRSAVPAPAAQQQTAAAQVPSARPISNGADPAGALKAFLPELLPDLPRFDRIDTGLVQKWMEFLGLVRATPTTGDTRQAANIHEILSPLLQRETFVRELLQARHIAAPNPAAVDRDSQAAGLEEALLPYIRDGIKLIEQTLAQSMLQRATLGLQQEAQQPINLSFTLPVFDAEQVKPLRIELRQRERSQATAESTWDVRLSFDFNGLGAVSCHVFLQGYKVAASFYCDRENTRIRLQQALPELRYQLAGAGFDPGELQSFRRETQPPETIADFGLSEALLDIEV